MKVIFLDIDGVMNRFPHQAEDEFSSPYSRSPTMGFLAEPVRLVQQFASCGVKIVISSSWRFSCNTEALLKALGVTNESFAGYTTTRPMGGRGGEILDWISTHPGLEAFAIIDDSVGDIQQEELQEHIVQTETHIGLTEELAVEATKILKL